MALFCPQGVEVVFLYRSQCDRTDCSSSSDKCILFFVVGFIWRIKSSVHFWRQFKSIFDYCNVGRDLYFVDYKVGFQVIYPQGSLYPGLRYGLVAAFILVSLCYTISLIIVVSEKNII